MRRANHKASDGNGLLGITARVSRFMHGRNPFPDVRIALS